MEKVLLRVNELTKHFPVEKGLMYSILPHREKRVVHAVCKASLSVKKRETVGLVGESGSGKTTLGRCILKLIEPTSGKIYFDGVELSSLKRKPLRRYRKEMQIIFQDPFSSLNPRMKAKEIIGHPMELHGVASKGEVKKKVIELLEAIGLNREHMNRYPHQFSGGQKQRIAIARALSTNPRFIVADEPTSSLDVSVQASILNLFLDLKEKHGFSCLFISHDLGTVEHVSDRIAVMYLGKIVEIAKADDLFNSPEHPYTKALLSAFPVPDPKASREKIALKGEIPSPINPPSGCRFHTRCPTILGPKSECVKAEPELKDEGNEHCVACHLFT